MDIGTFPAHASSRSSKHDLCVTVELFADGLLLTSFATTVFGSDFNNEYVWNEMLSFPLKYSELPLNSIFVFTIWNMLSPTQKVSVGSASFRVFGNNNKLRKGRQKLTVLIGKDIDIFSSPGKHENKTEIDRLEKLIKKYERGQIQHVDWLDKLAFRAFEKVNEATESDPDRLSLFIKVPDFKYPVIYYEQIDMEPIIQQKIPHFEKVNDNALSENNPSESKYLLLSRGTRRTLSILDKDLKPNRQENILLKEIINYAPTRRLTVEEKELIWKFRFYLQNQRKALTKFLKCVDWNKTWEEKEALKLMEEWEPIQVDDVLELLSFYFKEKTEVRSYAVRFLAETSEEDLLLYLLQLVQALRYDEDPRQSDLAAFLIEHAISNKLIVGQLYWYLRVEKDENEKFGIVMDELLMALEENGQYQTLREFEEEEKLISNIVDLSKTVAKYSVARKKKIEKASKMISKGGEFENLSHFDMNIPIPLNTEVVSSGIKPKIHIFNSAMAPLKLDFIVGEEHENNKDFSVMFKVGDDLRQDQLIVQLITLMDELLQKENLDLKLTPYRVLATSPKDGMIELVQDTTNVADVILKYQQQPILTFLREKHPDPHGPFGVDNGIIDNFLRSCAGYCVITYILGIGDRHLDNLLLCTDGRLLHIDFGFILGRDPKPLPPPMKLCPEMVEAMGGLNGELFLQYKSYCCTAYNILRKSSNLILNLVTLMIDANIEHINQGEKSVMKVESKFALHLEDEQANEVFQQLINESVRALAPQVSEAIHRWKKYWTS
eukprot:TRINITY_DN11120_c0_g1_i1.p1 TRINITY_DN11120_c0_g1~~TRINITY_DN11120_c0_g1_i1.p1  ORF type:complete len:820 (-),score=165.41 TRINITY_DN11120_c0_g1_i1:36-2366(-)